MTTERVHPHVAKERRLAAIRAARGAQVWKEEGLALLAAKQAEEERKRLVRVERFVDDVEFASYEVDPSKLSRHVEAFERMLNEASEDSGVEPDSIAYDMMGAYLSVEVLTGTLTLARLALAVALLRSLSMTTTESLDYIRRNFS